MVLFCCDGSVVILADVMALTLYMRDPKEPALGDKPMSKGLRQLDIEELYHLSNRIDEDPVEIATLLFPDKPHGRIPVIEKIGQWAINQTVVLECVQNNKPDVAILFGKVGNRIWTQLPAYAQCIKINIK
jgi:hypothetical protein